MSTWDEPVGKKVGRHVSETTSIQDAAALLKTVARLLPAGVCTRGVWRFRSFEEADEWAQSQAARRPAPRS